MKITVAATMLLACFTAYGVQAENVDLLLVLAADVSRSIDDGAFNLQRKGYAAAMTDPRVLRAITGGRNRAIAVTFIEWSGASDQNVVVDWSVVRDEEAAGVVAATILAAPRSFAGRTSISGNRLRDGTVCRCTRRGLQACPRHLRGRGQQFRSRRY